MDQAMIERVANTAGRAGGHEAAEQIFLALGVDISTPGKVIEAQMMFSGMRSFQDDLRTFKNRFWASLGGLMATGLAAVAYHYVQTPKPPI